MYVFLIGKGYFHVRITVKLRKPFTPEIFMLCYICVVARKNQSGVRNTKPQTATVISLWFCGLLWLLDRVFL